MIVPYRTKRIWTFSVLTIGKRRHWFNNRIQIIEQTEMHYAIISHWRLAPIYLEQSVIILDLVAKSIQPVLRRSSSPSIWIKHPTRTGSLQKNASWDINVDVIFWRHPQMCRYFTFFIKKEPNNGFRDVHRKHNEHYTECS